MNCGLCGHEITKECNAGGYYQKTDDGEIDIKLCHPDYPSDDHRDCYHLYTVYGATSKSTLRRIDIMTKAEERDALLDEMIDHAIENDLYEKTKNALPKKELS